MCAIQELNQHEFTCTTYRRNYYCQCRTPSHSVDIAVVQWDDDDNDTAGDVYTGVVCSCKSLVDLTLVLDSSTTVRDWTAIREFAVSIIDWFDVGQSQARVAVVVVGRTSSVVVRLDQLSHDRQQLYSAIRNIPLAGGPRSLYFSLVTSHDLCLRRSTVFCCAALYFADFLLRSVRSILVVQSVSREK